VHDEGLSRRVRNNFGVDSSSRLSFRGRTDTQTQTNKQIVTDATNQPTQAADGRVIAVSSVSKIVNLSPIFSQPRTTTVACRLRNQIRQAGRRTRSVSVCFDAI